MKQAAILAGGKGSRLSKVSADAVPKSMMPIAGRPLLEILVETLVRQDITELVFFTGYESAKIEKHFGDGRRFGASIRYVVESEPLGSAGSLLANLESLDERFLIVYGDTLFNVDFKRFEKFHEDSGKGLSLFLHPNDHPYDSDLVELGPKQRVTAFHKTPHPEGVYRRNLVNAALYIADRRAFEGLGLRGPADFARDVFPLLLSRGARINGYVSREYVKDMGTPDRLEKVERDVRTGTVARGNYDSPVAAVFLDRDGTLTAQTDYVRTPEELELLPEAGRAVSRLNSGGTLAVLVTNQPVIARGEVTERQLETIHNKLEWLLGKERAYLDAIYFCPHHPDRGFDGERSDLKIDCECRKPKSGMIEAAILDLYIDRNRSWFVGDSTADLSAAARAGVKSILVRTGLAGRDRKYSVQPDFEVSGVVDAADLICGDYDRIRGLLGPILNQLEKGRPVVVAGPARSGKSLIASTIRQLLLGQKWRAHVLSLDHWLKPEAARGKTVVERYDLDRISGFLRDLRDEPDWAGRMPYYDRHTRQVDPEGFQIELARGDTLIYEGTIAMHVPDLLKLEALRLYVESPAATRRARFEKEYRLRGWEQDRIETVFAAREAEEVPFIESSKIHSDYIMNLANWSVRENNRELS